MGLAATVSRRHHPWADFSTRASCHARVENLPGSEHSQESRPKPRKISKPLHVLHEVGTPVACHCRLGDSLRIIARSCRETSCRLKVPSCGTHTGHPICCWHSHAVLWWLCLGVDLPPQAWRLPSKPDSGRNDRARSRDPFGTSCRLAGRHERLGIQCSMPALSTFSVSLRSCGK